MLKTCFGPQRLKYFTLKLVRQPLLFPLTVLYTIYNFKLRLENITFIVYERHIYEYSESF